VEDERRAKKGDARAFMPVAETRPCVISSANQGWQLFLLKNHSGTAAESNLPMAKIGGFK